MNITKENLYFTTAIDYPNGPPHLGHAYEKVVTDCYVRWYRLNGHKVFLTTGTDENGQKLVKAAESVGMSTLQLVNENVDRFRKLCTDLNIQFDDFIRTTEKRHIKTVYDLWHKMKTNGDIYLGKYSGHYCIACETFYTETQAEKGQCPVHKIPLTFMEEDGYFFKLSRYQEWITTFLTETPNFLFPKSVRVELLSRLNGEKLGDLSISRPNEGWGIEVPDDSKHVIYTWFDALISYYTSALYDDHGEPRIGVTRWPAFVHVIGKDISWFHAVIWPTMLKSAGICIPKQIYIHGMVLGSDGKRMSKTVGNGVDPQDCLQEFSVDSFRYFMLKVIPSGQDGAFSKLELARTHNSDLANEFGNLIMRVVKLSLGFIGKNVEVADLIDFELDFIEQVSEAMDSREHSKALGLIWNGVRKLNSYINQEEPWKKKTDKIAFHRVMYTALFNLNIVCVLLIPFIPASADCALNLLGSELSPINILKKTKGPFQLSDGQPLFPRIELATDIKAN